MPAGPWAAGDIKPQAGLSARWSVTPKEGEPAVPKGKHMLLGDRCYVHPSGSMYRCAVENVASDVGTAFLARVATCALPRHEKDWVISGAMDFGDEASVLTDTTLKIAAPDGRVVTVMINTRVITKPLEKAGMYRYVDLRVFRDGDAK